MIRSEKKSQYKPVGFRGDFCFEVHFNIKFRDNCLPCLKKVRMRYFSMHIIKTAEPGELLEIISINQQPGWRVHLSTKQIQVKGNVLIYTLLCEMAVKNLFSLVVFCDSLSNRNVSDSFFLPGWHKKFEPNLVKVHNQFTLTVIYVWSLLWLFMPWCSLLSQSCNRC